MQVAMVAMFTVGSGNQVSANLPARLESARMGFGDKAVKEIESKAPPVAGVHPGFKRRGRLDDSEPVRTIVFHLTVTGFPRPSKRLEHR